MTTNIVFIQKKLLTLQQISTFYNRSMNNNLDYNSKNLEKELLLISRRVLCFLRQNGIAPEWVRRKSGFGSTKFLAFKRGY